MLIVRVTSSHLEGHVTAPSSKSYTHRALVCGLLSRGKTSIKDPLMCDDTMTTIEACRQMGATLEMGRPLAIESEGELKEPSRPIDCQGSGTTLRFFVGLSALVKGKTLLTGNSTLMRRPVGQLMTALQYLGASAVSLNGNGCPPVAVDGSGFTGGTARLEGNVSSQFVSALLLACSRGSISSNIIITTELESLPYVRMTLEVMQHFGVRASVASDWRAFSVPSDQTYRCHDYEVQGDYSSAALILAAGVLCGETRVSGLLPGSLQGDSKIVEVLEEMSASIATNSTTVTAEMSELRSIDVDVSDIPDLVPIMAVLASQAKGRSTFTGVKRLRMKESDRVAAISSELSKMGVSIHSEYDTLVVDGPTRLRGALIDPHNDHRIAMACAVAGLIASGETVIVAAECVAKSYPGFFEDLEMVGAAIEKQSWR